MLIDKFEKYDWPRKSNIFAAFRFRMWEQERTHSDDYYFITAENMMDLNYRRLKWR